MRDRPRFRQIIIFLLLFNIYLLVLHMGIMKSELLFFLLVQNTLN